MPEDDLDNLEDQQNEGPKALREALQREKDRASAAQAELDALKRDAAFRDAGVDLTNPLHAAAVKGYDGDIGGISDWVGNLGLNAPPPSPQGVSTEEQQGLERIFQASAGDQAAQQPQPEIDKNNELREITERARREGWTNTRYDDEMRQTVAKYGGQVASLPYTMIEQR